LVRAVVELSTVHAEVKMSSLNQNTVSETPSGNYTAVTVAVRAATSIRSNGLSQAEVVAIIVTSSVAGLILLCFIVAVICYRRRLTLEYLQDLK
jgi:hypothetical protein